MSTNFSCYLIGQDLLLIKCAEILIEKGQSILGIITSNAIIKKWATEKEINIFKLDKDLESVLNSSPYDYLFSITNFSILSNEIINSPEKGAINFHDGPLPSYAGINTTSWALMNQEKKYAVTWHEITNEIDKGDILKQKYFNIDHGETALSLNAKCFEAGVKSFVELVSELADGSFSRIKQNFSKRTYFGKFKKPDYAALVNWNNDADKILAFINSLKFGHYKNPLGLPKIKIGNKYFIIGGVEDSLEKSDRMPGEITGISENQIKVASKSNDLSISRLLRMDGQPIDIKEVIEHESLQIGTRLSWTDDTIAKLIGDLYSNLAKEEEYWVNVLLNMEPLKINYSNKIINDKLKQSFAEEKLNISEGVINLLKEKDKAPTSVLYSLFSIFIGRYESQYKFTIGYTDPWLMDTKKKFGNLFAEFVPINIELDVEDTILMAIKKNYDKFNPAVKSKTFIKDIFLRYPELYHLLKDGGEPIYPVGIAMTEGDTNYIPQSSSMMTFVISSDLKSMKFVYDSNLIKGDYVRVIMAKFASFIEAALYDEITKVADISIISLEEKSKLIEEWNNTKVEYNSNSCIHQLFEKQVEQSPDSISVFCSGDSLTYEELNKKSNQLARKLIKEGVGTDTKVGIYMHRSVEIMVTILGVLKAGGAYVPLDPDFPLDRINYMIQDSKCNVIISEQRLKNNVSSVNSTLIFIDTDWKEIQKEETKNLFNDVSPDNLAYIIYTSGSTGNPKGVMVTHKNVVNFFIGMDKHLVPEPAGSWLAVTSLSFDISVLELLWTVCRGFKVVIYTEEDWKIKDIKASSTKDIKKIDFSLFYFSSYASEDPNDKYRLLIEGAKFADQNKFAAVWTPERHFHDFGGLYPNPAVTSAALAAITKNIRIMSGSCVSPLHHPLRIAEDWSIVDNLSKGRIGISFAAGWQPMDFILMPQNYEQRKDIMFEQIEVVRKLWRGEEVEFDSPVGKRVALKTFPRPIQKELPVWITAANNPETFKMAGERGFYILTHLLGQSIEDLEDKIAHYRKAWKSNNHPGKGFVTIMLHTFVGENLEEVKETVREPMKRYLSSAVNLVKLASWYFPTFNKFDGEFNKDAEQLSQEDMDAILDHSFERYFETSALLGTPDSCLKTIERLKNIDVDEAACLIDFGVEQEKVLSHLQYLNAVKTLANLGVRENEQAEKTKYFSFPELIRDQKVTHFQCTPSMARMLLMDDDSKRELKSLRFMLIGGESFPVNLARELKENISGKLLNVYGPTETTIWSTIHQVDEIQDSVPIGKPIANTEIYILDSNNKLVPTGVAGELCIGGEGVTRGYLNRPELTKEKFITLSLNGTANQKRIYKTGDLAYYRSDGTIEYLGRFDNQIKIRGYRIELGEIESQLLTHFEIREAVVMAREDEPGDQRLVAYLIAKKKSFKDIDSIKKMLRERLPEYMVPSNFVFMEEFPLTPNGKIDRKAFRSPFTEEAETLKTEDGVKPETEIEKKISEIWKEILKLPKVGTNDNFFDSGGHSLLAVQLHMRLKQEVDNEVTLIDIFKYPTISTLAEHLNKKVGKKDESNVPRESRRVALSSKSKMSQLRMNSRDNTKN